VSDEEARQVSQATSPHPETQPQPLPAAEAQLLDFTQPTKFTTELRRRIASVLTPFCKATSARLASELRAPVQMRVIEARQLTWTAARSAQPQDAFLVALKVNPVGKQMLLTLEQPLILRALNCLLGGSAAGAPQARRLSDIDWALMRRLIDSLVLQLSLVWRDLGGLELEVDELDVDGDAGLFVPIGEPTYAVTLEFTVAELQSEISLLIPWAAVEPVVGEILGRGGEPEEADPQQTQGLQRRLASADLLVRAEVGATHLGVEEVLAIEPGTVLRLDTKAENGVRLLAESVALARGVPGRSGAHRAVKLTTPIEPRSDGGARSLPAVPTRGRAVATPGAQAMLGRLRQLPAIDVRVWAELGRTHVSLGTALGLPKGAVLELDQGAEDPLDLFVNGLRLASGALIVTADGEWAVKVGALG
jgi:flagellar motor switch protein FliM